MHSSRISRIDPDGRSGHTTLKARRSSRRHLSDASPHRRGASRSRSPREHRRTDRSPIRGSERRDSSTTGNSRRWDHFATTSRGERGQGSNEYNRSSSGSRIVSKKPHLRDRECSPDSTYAHPRRQRPPSGSSSSCSSSIRSASPLPYNRDASTSISRPSRKGSCWNENSKPNQAARGMPHSSSRHAVSPALAALKARVAHVQQQGQQHSVRGSSARPLSNEESRLLGLKAAIDQESVAAHCPGAAQWADLIEEQRGRSLLAESAALIDSEDNLEFGAFLEVRRRQALDARQETADPVADVHRETPTLNRPRNITTPPEINLSTPTQHELSHLSAIFSPPAASFSGSNLPAAPASSVVSSALAPSCLSASQLSKPSWREKRGKPGPSKPAYLTFL
eukprot:GHVT01066712.1.p1 GENE.GHVT01066712.1~~GHVT01066712.1.p1  ORF type:complete len:395 (+),score=46.69 GHVT01066712.1:526-1710(+)